MHRVSIGTYLSNDMMCAVCYSVVMCVDVVIDASSLVSACVGKV